MKKKKKHQLLLYKAIFLLFTALVLGLNSCSNKSKEKKEYIPVAESKTIFTSTKLVPDHQYLGDQVCKECHNNEYKAWKGSHHDKAMQTVSDSTVLANFNNFKFTSQGITSHFYKKENDFYVNTEGRDGKYHDYKIEYVFGVYPLQQYIVKFPDGHYQCLRTAWDSKENKWYDLYPNFKVVHSEWLHWSRGGLNWNTMCADCHSTNVRKNYDESTHSYNTKYSIINVNCEACHGPGKKHVELATKLGDNYKPSGNLKMAPGIAPKKLVDECARCHVRREQISSNFNHEGTFLDHYTPQLITPDVYHVDGQILDEDYVYGSFVQSKMYHNGVTCTNCHNAHSLKLKFKGNKLCAQCHKPETYDTTTHHKHPLNTESALCINCHMPGKYYMGNDFRRDHSFRIPRPDLSVKYNTPNACVGCHKNKNNKWAEEQFKALYGIPNYNHFSDLLAPGLTDIQNGMKPLMKLAKDTIYPNIARASAIKGMSNYLTPEVVNDLLVFLNDKAAIVRSTSLSVLGELNNKEYIYYFLPLLKDKKRAVRIKAFYAVSGVNKNDIPAEYKEVYKVVEKEYFTALNITSDFVGGRVNKAKYYLKKGDTKKAIAMYESALEIDNINNLLRSDLANLYYTNGDTAKAESTFETIIKQEPEYGPTYYSYSLLLAELGKTEKAIKMIIKGLKYMPKNIRLYYNLSLLYDKLNENEKATTTLINGLRIDPYNENLLYTLAYLYGKNKEFSKAKKTISKLLNIAPNNPQYLNFMKQLQAVN